MTPKQYQDTKSAPQNTADDSRVMALLSQTVISQTTELARGGRYNDAEQILALNLESPTAPVLDLLARIRAQQGRLAEAEKLWSEAVRQDPNNEFYRAALQRLARMNRQSWFVAMSQWFPGIVLFALVLVVTDFGFHNWWRQERRLLVTEIQVSSLPAHGQAASVPQFSLNLPGVTQTTEGDDSVLRFDQGLFKDSDVLTPQAKVVLAAVAERLHSFSNKPSICVIGYSDNLPLTRTVHYRDNRFLNIARAQTVAQYLAISAGIPERQFTLQSAEGSLFPNDSQENRAKNRSVTIRVAVERY